MEYKLPKDLYNTFEIPKIPEFENLNELTQKTAEELTRIGREREEYIANQYYEKGYRNAKAKYDRGHGHWIYNTDDFTPKMRCSVCGYNRPVKCICNSSVSTMFVEQEPANFCNNCGAEMDEEVQDD